LRAEGRLIRIPEEVRCKICGEGLETDTIGIDGEEMMEAFVL
jgi:hypothetical protein